MTQTFTQLVQRLDFNRHSAAFETSPAVVTAEIARFACPAGRSEPMRVPVEPWPHAQEGWCFRNVQEAHRKMAGLPMYGWVVWMGAYFMTREYHAILMTPERGGIDITPKGDGESFVLFGEDPDAGAEFDYLKRPAAVRMRTYKGRSQLERAGDLISCLSDKQMKAMRVKAERAGMSLQNFVVARTPARDSLEIAIDALLDCSDEIEAMLTPTPDGLYAADVELYERLMEKKLRLLKRLDGAAAAHKRLVATIEGPAR